MAHVWDPQIFFRPYERGFALNKRYCFEARTESASAPATIHHQEEWARVITTLNWVGSTFGVDPLDRRGRDRRVDAILLFRECRGTGWYSRLGHRRERGCTSPLLLFPDHIKFTINFRDKCDAVQFQLTQPWLWV